MTFQERMIEDTKAAADEVFKFAKATAPDKIDWAPLEQGRTVLDICRELAMCPKWCEDIISGTPMPEWNEEAMAKIQAEKEQWNTLDECQAECNRRLDSLFAAFRAMPDERLAETKWLPYDGGRDFSMPEMMNYPRWNFTYHMGQIGYIQTLYGDRDMH